MKFNSKKQYHKYWNYCHEVGRTEVSFEKQVPIPHFTQRSELQGYLKGMEKYYEVTDYGAVHLKYEYFDNRPTVPLVVTRVEIEAEFLPDGRERLEKYRAQLAKKVAEIDSLLG